MAESFSVLLLAGSRSGADPVAAEAGVASKIFVPVCGKPMIEHVLATVLGLREVRHVIVVTDAADLLREIDIVASANSAHRLSFVQPAETPSTSVLQALDHPQATFPLLITTADTPLLTVQMVRWFWGAVPAEADVAAAVARGVDIRERFPLARRTFLKFSDGDFSGCNLFALKSPEARRLVNYWRQLEAHRKRPVKMARLLGLPAVIRYLLGRLSLRTAAENLSRRAGAKAAIVPIPFAEAAVDVDKPEDLPVVEHALSERKKPAR
ncbi:MAG TPA: NTP transferase domain-containing protein [Alphaproteobacteria bacterium]|nr:NTP transferase domain-containing protein [Alphaproteobacteria bacterium]